MAVMQSRHLHLVLGIGCLALVGFAVYYLQGALGLLPCPLCVMQRIAYILFGFTALAAAWQRPSGGGRWLYAGLLGVWSLTGAAIAGWQVYLTYHPQAAECGVSPEERFLNSLPLSQWWPAMFEANGDCARVDWTFLGLSVPELSLIAFILLAGFAIIAARRPATR
ncbi:MAG: disulfide bond formation protein B [Zoogloeaceae bacterium]|jgi:disulfide bond formation protein DsbB|nr:disulfide bond formation protein B [Zoogloeaceae bacterium]